MKVFFLALSVMIIMIASSCTAHLTGEAYVLIEPADSIKASKS